MNKITLIENTLSPEKGSKGMITAVLENGEKSLVKDLPSDVIREFNDRVMNTIRNLNSK